MIENNKNEHNIIVYYYRLMRANIFITILRFVIIWDTDDLMYFS